MHAKRLALRAFGLLYLAGLLVLPVGMVIWSSVQGGAEPFFQAIIRPTALNALALTILVASICVPANTAFGVWCALRIVRGGLPRVVTIVINTLIDMPFVISDVVVGLALLALYGSGTVLGPWLDRHGLPVVFALPGMVLATAFISLPFVVREVVPVLRQRGMQQEQVASTLGASPFQILWRVTLPSIRRAVMYGVVLTTARAVGEFGAISVVSGRVAGRTQTLTIFVDDRFQSFDLEGAYAAAVVLALLAMATLIVMRRLSKSPWEAAT